MLTVLINKSSAHMGGRVHSVARYKLTSASLGLVDSTAST